MQHRGELRYNLRNSSGFDVVSPRARCKSKCLSGYHAHGTHLQQAQQDPVRLPLECPRQPKFPGSNLRQRNTGIKAIASGIQLFLPAHGNSRSVWGRPELSAVTYQAHLPLVSRVPEYDRAVLPALSVVAQTATAVQQVQHMPWTRQLPRCTKASSPLSPLHTDSHPRARNPATPARSLCLRTRRT